MPNSNLNKNNHQYDYFRYIRTTPASISILRCMFGMFFFRSSPNRFIDFILTRSVLIVHINIGLIMIENKHTKHDRNKFIKCDL